MTNLNKKFTGGDNLEGFEKKLHEVLMQTELRDGYGAYELSYAKGKSGLSFGGNQMDLGRDKKPEHPQDPNKYKYGAVLFEILKEAKDKSGNAVLSQAEQNEVLKRDYWVRGRTPEAVFGDLLPKINSALSSDYGVQKINETYVKEIRKKISDVERIISALTNEGNKKALSTNDELKIKLVDYHNQFNLEKGGAMMHYLNGDIVPIINYEYDEKGERVKHAWYGGADVIKSKVHLQLEGEPTIDDINYFVRCTDQYNKSSKSTENRLKKLEEARGRPYTKPMQYYKLNSNLPPIEVGDRSDCSLRGRGMLATRSLTLQINRLKLKSCIAHIRYDDHAWLTVNDKVAYESTQGLGSGYIIQQENDVNYVVLSSGGCKFRAETGCSKGFDVDIAPYLVNGINTLKLNVIVEDGGCAYMRVMYNQ